MLFWSSPLPTHIKGIVSYAFNLVHWFDPHVQKLVHGLYNLEDAKITRPIKGAILTLQSEGYPKWQEPLSELK